MGDYYDINEEYGLKHFQLPKVFTTNDEYKKMDANSKIAWAILRDRFQLSKKNGWFDEQGRIFFIYSNEKLMEILDINSKTTLQKIKKELINNGLLEQKRMGLKQPNRLYLKKPKVTEEDIYRIDKLEEIGSNPYESTEVQKMDFKKYRKWTSRSTENGLQEVQKMDSNDTDLSNTDLSNTDLSNHYHHLVKAGFESRQAKLISRFALDNKIKADDDDFHKLVIQLKDYNFNSVEYIAKTYDTIMNQNNRYIVSKNNNKNELADFKKQWEKQINEQKKSPEQLERETEELSSILSKYSNSL